MFHLVHGACATDRTLKHSSDPGLQRYLLRRNSAPRLLLSLCNGHIGKLCETDGPWRPGLLGVFISLWHCHLVSRAPASPAGGGCVLLAAAPTLTVPPLVFWHVFVAASFVSCPGCSCNTCKPQLQVRWNDCRGMRGQVSIRNFLPPLASPGSILHIAGRL